MHQQEDMTGTIYEIMYVHHSDVVVRSVTVYVIIARRVWDGVSRVVPIPSFPFAFGLFVSANWKIQQMTTKNAAANKETTVKDIRPSSRSNVVM